MRLLFGAYVLDTEARQLRKDDEPLHLTTKAFDLLVQLSSSRPRVLSKAEIQQRLWPETHVVEANLPNLVAEIRTALADDARSPRFVRTVHGVGYAFCGEAVEEAPSGRPGAESPFVYRLTWEGGVVALAEGEYILGRHSDSIVPIDADTVSRRHARLRIGEGRAVLDDLDSHNGTYAGGERVTGPTVLADGDMFKMGSVTLVFRALRSTTIPETRDL